ncbi:MAG: hypothetical protein LBL85_01775 [Methanocalculaceae archaeon]|nr:hypothetical protein [Methanocalculaceae archaeon]
MREQKFISFSTKAEDVFIQMIQELVADSTNIIPYAGFYGVRNWGDAINSVFLRQLSGKLPLISY